MRKFLLHVLLLTVICSTTLSGLAYAGGTVGAAMKHDGMVLNQDKPRSGRSIFSPISQLFSPKSASAPNEKLLSNVKIFPNPVSEQINLSFRLGKQTDVTIKVMDALGNEVMNLLNQRLEGGNQNHAFETHNKLSKGYYFIKVSANAETVVKRITVL